MGEVIKKCVDCGGVKPLKDFHLRSAAKDGHQNRCKTCAIAATKKWREEHREQNRNYQREWQATDRRRARNQANHFKRKYGLTMEQREAMIAEQQGRCYLCSLELELHVDHDEVTKVNRKMLCGNCNRGLGCLMHDADLLRRAADYIEMFGTKAE